MTRHDHNPAETARLGRNIYETKLKKLVETDENLGKIISIDVESGDYVIGDSVLSSSDRMLARRPGSRLYGIRIGYDAVYSIGGTISRTNS